MTQPPKRCPECYNINAFDVKYCSQCGHPLNGQPETLVQTIKSHQSTIAITSLATICVFLLTILLAFSNSQPPAPHTFVATNTSANVVNTKAENVNVKKTNASVTTKTLPKLPPVPKATPTVIPTPEPEIEEDETYGATARCRDGSLSYSQSRRGTCSHHGGVAEWY